MSPLGEQGQAPQNCCLGINSVRHISGRGKMNIIYFRGGGEVIQIGLCLGDRRFPQGASAIQPNRSSPPSSSIQKVWDPCGAEVSRLRPRRPAGEGEGASAPLLASQDARRPHMRSPRRRPGQHELLGKSRPRGSRPWFPQGGRDLRGGFPGEGGACAEARGRGRGCFPGEGGTRSEATGGKGRGQRRAASVGLLKIFH